jgi:hypothetical protein
VILNLVLVQAVDFASFWGFPLVEATLVYAICWYEALIISWSACILLLLWLILVSSKALPGWSLPCSVVVRLVHVGLVRGLVMLPVVISLVVVHWLVTRVIIIRLLLVSVWGHLVWLVTQVLLVIAHWLLGIVITKCLWELNIIIVSLVGSWVLWSEVSVWCKIGLDLRIVRILLVIPWLLLLSSHLALWHHVWLGRLWLHLFLWSVKELVELILYWVALHWLYRSLSW